MEALIKNMKILFFEIRRYLRPITLAIVCVLTVFWILMHNSYYTKSPYRAWGLLSVEYQKRFGNVIDADEFEIIKQDYADLCAEIDRAFEKYMGEYDVHSLDDFRLLENASFHIEEDYRTAAERWGSENIEELYQKCLDIYFDGPMEAQSDREQKIGYFIYDFESLDKAAEAARANDPDWGYDKLTDYQKNRILEDCQRHELSIISVLSSYSYTEFRDGFKQYSVLIYIICAFIGVPFLVNNKVTGTQTIQFASKRGKNILKNQLGAALTVSAIFNIIIDAFFYIVYFYNGDEIHYLLNCPINVGAAGNQLWINMTYFQYVLLIFAKVMLLSLALTCAIFIVSYFSKNYIVATAIAVPSFMLVSTLSEHLDYHFNLVFNYAWEYPLMLFAPIAAIVAVTIIVMRRTWRTDYLY